MEAVRHPLLNSKGRGHEPPLLSSYLQELHAFSVPSAFYVIFIIIYIIQLMIEINYLITRLVHPTHLYKDQHQATLAVTLKSKYCAVSKNGKCSNCVLSHLSTIIYFRNSPRQQTRPASLTSTNGTNFRAKRYNPSHPMEDSRMADGEERPGADPTPTPHKVLYRAPMVSNLPLAMNIKNRRG